MAGAGFENNIVYCEGKKLNPSTAQDITNMQSDATAVSEVNYTGSPENNVSANPSSMCHDPVAGNVYIKGSGTGTTGWSQITTAASYPITPPNGGTGLSSPTAHSLLVTEGASNMNLIGPGTAGQVLQSGGAGVDPSFSTATYPGTAGTSGTLLQSNGTNILNTSATYPGTVAQGDLLYGSAANAVSSLAKNTTSTRYISNTGTSNSPAWAQVALTTGVSGTLPVGNGGTNATSFATTNGIVTYDGSKLVTNSSPQIVSNIYSNGSQPLVCAYVHTAMTNATGDGTAVVIVFDGTAVNQGSGYSTVTGKYTCPVNGTYLVCYSVTFNNLSASFTSAEINILSSAATITRKVFQPGASLVGGQLVISDFIFTTRAASDTLYVQVSISGSTKTVGITADSFGLYSYFNIMKVA